MSFPIQPQGDRMIVRPLKRKEEKLNGLIIPETANAELEVGEVLVVSQEVYQHIKAGDIVTYPTKGGVGQLINGEPCIWLQMGVIWGVWNPKEWAKLNSDNE